jgi:hypothetical protein
MKPGLGDFWDRVKKGGRRGRWFLNPGKLEWGKILRGENSENRIKRQQKDWSRPYFYFIQ